MTYYFIAGATAVGKTEYAVNLAEKIGGEVICADSMQIYKYMDIGTAKITAEEMRGVPHHMINIITPDTPYSVAQYKAAALLCAEEIVLRGKIPIFTGGTGLYINSVLFDYEFTGEKLSIRDMSAPKIPAKVIVLNRPRDVLYARVNARADAMLAGGLLEEVQKLLGMGYDFSSPGMKGIGYREFKPYFEGSADITAVAECIKKNSRAYAKRQMTWFRSWRFADIEEV